MIELHANSDSDVDGPDAMGVLADEFIANYRQGLNPSIEDYCERYPDMAARIRDVFSTLLLVEQCGASVSRNSTTDTSGKSTVPTCIGDFQIIREIGRGGMGIVYEAEQQSLGRRVALKVLPSSASLSPSTIERFRRESRAAARLHHSNIVPVFGVGEDDGLHYYVMQCIHGVGMDQILAQLGDSKRSLLTKFHDRSPHTDSQPVGDEPRVDEIEAIAAISSGSGASGSRNSEDRVYWHRVALIGLQLANALEFAHSQGVLHRDLKPANVLLDTHGQVWLTDFGLAQVSDDANLTRSGDIVGTLRYLAPERLKGECSSQSDVYGLGITLYELLTLVPAFAETDRAKLIQQIVQQNPKRPRALNAAIPRDLETIVLKSIEKEVSRRYATAAELNEDLSRFLSDRPIHARRVVMLEQAWRWCRRNPAIALLGSTVGVLLLGLSLAWGMFSWVQSDRDQARAAERVAVRAKEVARQAEAIADAQTHLARAQGHRHSTDPGHKARSLAEIGLAMEYDPPDAMRFELRNVAIASLVQSDIGYERLSGSWGAAVSTEVSFDREFQSYLSVEPSGTSAIRRTLDDELISRLSLPVEKDVHPRLSASGRYVFLYRTGPPGTLIVWDVARNEKLLGPLNLQRWYCVDSQENALFVCQGENAVHVYSLATGQEVRQLATSHTADCQALSPDGTRLAVSFIDRPGVVQIIDSRTADVAVEFATDTTIQYLDWHPDGQKLALAAGESYHAEVWDVATRRNLNTLVGHEQDVVRAAFDPTGEYVTTGSWDGTVRVWKWDTGQEIAVLTGSFLVNAWDRNVVGTQLTQNEIVIAKIDKPRGLTSLAVFSPDRMNVDLQGDTSPDGRLLATQSRLGLEFWNLEDGQKLAEAKQANLLSLYLDWPHQRIVTLGRTTGMQSWPIVDLDGQWRVNSAVSVTETSMLPIKACSTPDRNKMGL